MNCHRNSFSLRQHWLVVLIVIALHASFGVLAQVVSPSDSIGILHYSVERPKNATINELAGPKFDVAIVDNECQCRETHIMEAELLTSSTRIEELTTQFGILTANFSLHERESGNAAADCQKELTDAIADRNDSIQASKSLEEKIERMEREYSQVLNETWTDIELLEETAERQKRQLKSKEDRYQDTRKKLLEVDAELRRMHISAIKQYVNVTLMREDAFGCIERTARHVEKRWTHHYRKLRPRIQEAKRRYNRISRETQPKIVSFKRNMKDRWSQSKFVRPLLVSSWGEIRPIYQQYEPAVDEVKVACRLSTISAIEETSKGALAYLEKEDRMKEERERNKTKKDPTRRKRRNREASQMADASEKDIQPSVINLKARIFFKHTLTNSERLFERGVALLPLATALSVTRSGIVGSFLLFWGIPTPLIWAFTIVRFIIRLCRQKLKGTPETK